MKYSAWAVALIKHFFGPQFEGQRVRLLVTPPILDESFPQLGGMTGFVKAINDGPEWLGTASKTFDQRGKRLFEQWRQALNERPSGYPPELLTLKDAPPFIGYLCALCLTWTAEDEAITSSNAFYDRADRLFPGNELRSHLGSWGKIWEGPQDWTNRLNGKWGVFRVERLGEMQYVGIPKSQVILIPSRIEKVPLLFSACSLRPGSSLPIQQFREILANHSGTAQTVLGLKLWSEIDERSDLGTATLQLLLEHLATWDGAISTEVDRHSSRLTEQTVNLDLQLVLEPTEDNTRWAIWYGLRDEDNAEGSLTLQNGWKTLPAAHGLSLLVDRQGKKVDAVHDSSRWKNGFSCLGQRRASFDSETEISASLTGRQIRFFDGTWLTSQFASYLVESPCPSTSGPIYILVGPTKIQEWTYWVRGLHGIITLQEFSWPGLPTGWLLYCADSFDKLEEQDIASFPGGLEHLSRASRSIRFAGGTRVSSNAARRLYAFYDLPEIIVTSMATAMLHVAGAKAVEISVPSAPAALPGTLTRTFQLKVDDDASVVVATLTGEGIETTSASFGVWCDGVMSSERNLPGQTLDEIGRLGAAGSVRGAIFTGPSALWTFAGGPARGGRMCEHIDLAELALEFIEALYFHGERISYPEFRRCARDIVGAENWAISLGARWLMQLGYLECKSDSRGRWSYILPNPHQLYLLPFKDNGRFQAVISGCGRRDQLQKAVKIAHELGAQVDLHDSGFALVPPRIRFTDIDRDNLELIASELEFRFGSSPAIDIALYSSSLEHWIDSDAVPWANGDGPAPMAEYIPEKFAILEEERPNQSPYKLQVMPDTFSPKHDWYTLHDNGGIRRIGEPRYAFLTDIAWGMWKLQNSAADDEKTILPFEASTGQFTIPKQLRLPCLLGRSLALCSGLPPRAIEGYEAYKDRSLGVLPCGSKPYHGYSWAYLDIPVGNCNHCCR